MKIFKTTSKLQEYVKGQKSLGQSIGFTPTMGALHEGHFSLIYQSKLQSDVSICSIFVNPTQFNEASDLAKYPRTVEKDIQGLLQSNCDALFLPSVKEVYPHGSNYNLNVDLEGLDLRMEGEKRPGHFDGVVQVVHRLIECTSCDFIYMGQKDFQQFTIIGKMIENLELPVKLVVCPILRDRDGLAMSSRNARLKTDHREKANIIYRILFQAQEWLAERKSPKYISDMAMEFLSIPDFKPEYFMLIDGHSLAEIRDYNSNLIVACTAVWAGEVRLIDNMILKGRLH